LDIAIFPEAKHFIQRRKEKTLQVIEKNI